MPSVIALLLVIGVLVLNFIGILILLVCLEINKGLSQDNTPGIIFKKKKIKNKVSYTNDEKEYMREKGDSING